MSARRFLFGLGVLVAIALLPFALRLYAWSKATLHYAGAGRVACAAPINPNYLKRCNVSVDGPACTYESQTRLDRYHTAVEIACLSPKPHEPMVIEWAPQKNPEPPSLKPDGLGEVELAAN